MGLMFVLAFHLFNRQRRFFTTDTNALAQASTKKETSKICLPFSHQTISKMASSSFSSSMISTRLAFLLVSFSLGQLGDGLNIFQGIYLVGIGWAEGAVGTALSLMGLTSLVMQPFAGNWVDTTSIDRRWFLVIASLVTSSHVRLDVHLLELHFISHPLL